MRSIEHFIRKITGYNDKTAIIHEGKLISYHDLTERISNQTRLINEKGVRSNQLVFIIGDYSIEAIALFFALALNKNIIIPVTTELDAEINERLQESKPDWIFNLRSGVVENLSEHEEKDRHVLIQGIKTQSASGLLLFSSGSTGKPKAMVHNLDSLLESYLEKKTKMINFLVFLMFDHIGGLNTLLNCLSMGATITIPENRRPDHVCELIEKYKVNVLPASPTFLNLTLISKAFEKYDVSSLLMVTYGTEPMPEALLMRLKDMLPRVKFMQTFGTSETGIAKTVSKSSTSTFLKIEDPDQEFKIVNGELWLRSKTQILGYINHSNDCFTDDGWFKTGDLVEETSDGFLKIIGRSKEVINVGGEKVLPTEIETVVIELPQVVDCKAKGVANAITGQMVVIDVILADGFDPKVEKIVIRSHCRERLDAYKVPAKINFVSELAFSDRFKKIRQ